MKFAGKEVFFSRNDIIVSKTDPTGKLTYANDIFLDIAGFTEDEVIGKQHNILRHENMPRAIFHLLWSTLKSGNEIFAYVVNSTKNGDYYWVNAHVTPSYKFGELTGYHSTRRVPNPETIRQVILPLYNQLLEIEASHSSKRDGLEKSVQHLEKVMSDQGKSYAQFVSELSRKD